MKFRFKGRKLLAGGTKDKIQGKIIKTGFRKPKCASRDERINRMQYIHKMKQFSVRNNSTQQDG